MQHLTPLLAEISWSVVVLAIAFVFIYKFMMMIILIQTPKGGGLSGAFGAGGGGSGQTAFGAKTGDALTIATIAMFVIFLGFAIGLNFAARPDNIDGSGPPVIVAPDGAEAEVANSGDAAYETDTAANDLVDDATDAIDDATSAVEDAAGDAVDAVTDDAPPAEQP